MEIWTLIVKSNTFNFIFLILILFAVCKWLKVGQSLENAKDKVKETIDKSTKEKEKSVTQLAKAHACMENIEEEIKEIFSNTDENIKNIENKIEKETIFSIEKIENNTNKLKELEENNVFSKLSKQTALASIELAKSHIIKTLKNNPHYHENFIQKSINEFNKAEYSEK